LAGTIDAPPTGEFETVWDQVAAGRRCRRGIDKVGSEKRVTKLSWCVYEALREADAAFLDASDVVWLARDARQSRLLIRFKAARFCKGEIVVRQGVLGQAKNGGTTAAEILAATKAVITRACTKTHAPRHGNIDHETVVAEQCAGRLCQKIEALTVDSAADEVLAGELMRGQCQLLDCAQAALTPNLRLVLRDVTHASRRPRIRV
jgi:hypothetical protein